MKNSEFVIPVQSTAVEPTPTGWNAVVSVRHPHYYKDVSKLQFVDVYRILQLFNVTDPCLQHALKKILVAGGRGAGKDISRDVSEAIDSLKRWQEMRVEEGSLPASGERRQI